jgi:hypothetical protein
MTSRIKKVTYSTIAGVGLFAGAAGLSAAATGSGSDPAPPAAVTQAADTATADTEADDTGINCENGIDTATGDECDGGPAAAEADEATEAPDNEADEAESDGADDTGINCENGIDTATGDECDGGPAAAEADEATEAPDNEADEAESDGADDGVDHQFEGEEVGENGDGVPDANDANETDG